MNLIQSISCLRRDYHILQESSLKEDLLCTVISDIGRHLIVLREFAERGTSVAVSSSCSAVGIAPISGTFYITLTKLLKKLNLILERWQDHYVLSEPCSNYTINPLDSQKRDVLPQLREHLQNVRHIFRLCYAKPIHHQIETIQIGLKIGIYLDVDLDDEVGAGLISIGEALYSRFPFITTRSLLCGAAMSKRTEFSHDDGIYILEMEKYILRVSKKWDVYQFYNGEECGELIVFLPKWLCPEKKGLEKLRALDFVGDGIYLRPADFQQIFCKSDKKSTLEEFKSLFATQASLDKIFYLAGHGSNKSVGSFFESNYGAVLDFFAEQRCKGLVIVSCYAGGESSLLPFRRKKLPYFILIRSIGGFTMDAESEKKLNVRDYCDRFASFIERGTSTRENLCRRMVKVSREGVLPAVMLSKIWLAHARLSSTGFYVVGEGKIEFPITFVFNRTMELEAQQNRDLKIEIVDKPMICLHPTCVRVPLYIHTPNPLFLSMIPGSGGHFIQQVTIVSGTIEEFLQGQATFYRDWRNEMVKVFCIATFVVADKVYTQCMLYIAPRKTAFVCFCEGVPYFFKDGKLQRTSDYSYAVLYKWAWMAATASEAAVYAASAGGEASEDFLEVIASKEFLGDHYERIYHPLVLNEREEINSLKKYIYEDLNQERGVKALLVFQLFKKGDYEEGKNVLLDGLLYKEIDASDTDFEGRAFIFYALSWQDIELFTRLLQHGADVNAKDPTANHQSVLHYAYRYALQEKEEFLDQLLRFADDSSNEMVLNMNPVCEYDFTPLMYMQKQTEFYSRLCGQGADINFENNHGETMLSRAIQDGDEEGIRVLLELKANPNIGSPSAMTIALKRENMRFIQLLREAGGNIFSREKSGRIPFIEFIREGSLELLECLLEFTECDVNVEDIDGVNALMTVLMPGNEAKLAVLKQKGARFPREPSEVARRLFKQYIFCLYGNQNRISLLDKMMPLLEWDISLPILFQCDLSDLCRHY